ncbi:unnamed protein product [Paramecium pentaurelia]|uniref:Tr-type G domain-containing protein n=1 Tax=Paramecium pentaurelia TaxID=43138 RepID=A0A8S1TIL0_9CILI|nr:unnamed protein product [Paramecium pentaurelia]
MQQIDENQHKPSVRIALAGNTKCGKTTLLGVLTKGMCDDGQGSLRNIMVNYAHEIKKGGQTESIVFELIGFDKDGKQILSNEQPTNKSQYQSQVFQQSNSYLYLIDLCGDNKYFKHSISAINKCLFNLIIIVIAVDEGITRITVECLLICQLYKIPFIIVLTKCDLLKNKEDKDKIIFKIHNQVSNNFLYRKLVIAKDPKECANLMNQRLKKYENQKGLICPLFEVNNINREGIDSLLQFLFHFKNQDHLYQEIKSPDQPFQMDVFYTCNVKNIGEIPFGLIKSGTVKLDQIVSVGLDENKQIQCAKVISIQNVRTSLTQARSGEIICLILQPIIQQQIIDFTKIKIIADPKINIPYVKSFWANISILPGPTTVTIGFKPILELSNITQQVNLQEIIGDAQFLKSGDCALIKLQFLDDAYQPVYENQQFILRSSHSIAYGQVVNVSQQDLINDEQ